MAAALAGWSHGDEQSLRERVAELPCGQANHPKGIAWPEVVCSGLATHNHGVEVPRQGSCDALAKYGHDGSTQRREGEVVEMLVHTAVAAVAWSDGNGSGG
jgi:hypothetical protein